MLSRPIEALFICPACSGSGRCEDAVCCGAFEGGCCGNPIAQEAPCCPCSGAGRMSREQFLNHALILGDVALLAQLESMDLLRSLDPGAFEGLRFSEAPRL